MAKSAPKSGEYLEGKFWFERKSNLLTLGLTSSGVDELGEIQGIELPDEGSDCSKGDALITLDGSNGRIDLITPTSGVVSEVNPALIDEPERISEDPLEEGWLIKLEIEDDSELLEFLADELEAQDSSGLSASGGLRSHSDLDEDLPEEDEEEDFDEEEDEDEDEDLDEDLDLPDELDEDSDLDDEDSDFEEEESDDSDDSDDTDDEDLDEDDQDDEFEEEEEEDFDADTEESEDDPDDSDSDDDDRPTRARPSKKTAPTRAAAPQKKKSSAASKKTSSKASPKPNLKNAKAKKSKTKKQTKKR